MIDKKLSSAVADCRVAPSQSHPSSWIFPLSSRRAAHIAPFSNERISLHRLIDVRLKLFYIFMVMALIGKFFQHCRSESNTGVTHPRVMRNFITEHFIVLKGCAPSVTELFSRRNSIKIQLEETSGLSGLESGASELKLGKWFYC